MTSSATTIRGARTAISAGVVLLSAWDLVTWFREAPGFIAVLGAVVGILFVVKYLDEDAGRGTVIGLYAVLAFFGLMFASDPDMSTVLTTHAIWVFLVLIAMLVHRALGASLGGAAQRDQTKIGKKSEAARIKANRRAQVEYAERINREQNFQERATRPGLMTGFEPAELAAIDLDAVRPPTMFGNPGAGLHGAGFADAAVKRGEEGELNFAKALAKTGLLDRFATFWSVQMPDEAVGASAQFSTDIDCVIVTGKSVWLLDMKNYNQGDVTWKTEVTKGASGKDEHFLIAVDNVTGGLVGAKRKMSFNMKLATDRFTKRFTDNGVRFNVKPAVVLMPRNDGLGSARGVQWAGGIATGGVPDVIQWLSKEPPFNPRHRDASLLLAMLKPILKDESGSAPMPGNIRRAAPASNSPPVPAPAVPARSAAPASDPVPSASVGVPTSSANAAPPAGQKTCTDCGAVIQPVWTFCYDCGASL